MCCPRKEIEQGTLFFWVQKGKNKLAEKNEKKKFKFKKMKKKMKPKKRSRGRFFI